MEERTKTESESLQNQIVDYRNEIESHKTEQQELMLKKIALKQNVFNSEKEFEFIIQRKKKFAQMKDMYVLPYFYFLFFLWGCLYCFVCHYPCTDKIFFLVCYWIRVWVLIYNYTTVYNNIII